MCRLLVRERVTRVIELRAGFPDTLAAPGQYLQASHLLAHAKAGIVNKFEIVVDVHDVPQLAKELGDEPTVRIVR